MSYNIIIFKNNLLIFMLNFKIRNNKIFIAIGTYCKSSSAGDLILDSLVYRLAQVA